MVAQEGIPSRGHKYDAAHDVEAREQEKRCRHRLQCGHINQKHEPGHNAEQSKQPDMTVALRNVVFVRHYVLTGISRAA